MDAQKCAVKTDKNMKDARKSNILGFSRGTSSKTNEEKKKKVENQDLLMMASRTHPIN